MKVLQEQKHIARRFSVAAADYRAFAHIQNDLARELVTKLGDVRGFRVLDVGAGNGIAPRILSQAGADVVALDAAWGMVCAGRKHCPEAGWLQADASALALKPASCDAVFSASVYQWVDDLSGAFRAVRRVLKPGGRFAAAMFGQATVNELFSSIDTAARSLGRVLPPFKRLLSAEEVRQVLACVDFEEVRVSVERRKREFRDVRALLAWLKGIGANSLAKNFFWGKALLAATEKEFKGRSTTFEIIWIEAKA